MGSCVLCDAATYAFKVLTHTLSLPLSLPLSLSYKQYYFHFLTYTHSHILYIFLPHIHYLANIQYYSHFLTYTLSHTYYFSHIHTLSHTYSTTHTSFLTHTLIYILHLFLTHTHSLTYIQYHCMCAPEHTCMCTVIADGAAGSLGYLKPFHVQNDKHAPHP
jgi:hypothetical protein